MKKRLTLIFLALALAFSLVACGGEDDPTVCTSHVDADKNAKCDVCEAYVECASCVDEDKNAKCDVCGKDVPCAACVDEDKNAKCDVCSKDVPCTECVDENTDGKCDVCGKDVPLPVVNDIVLIENGTPKFQFVVADGLDESVLTTLNDSVIAVMQSLSGITVPVVIEGSENDTEMEYEVLICDVCSRGERYTMNRYELGKDGYVIKIVGNKIVINAGSDATLAEAILDFAYDVLDFENPELKDAKMTEKMVVIEYQDGYKITSLSVNGNDMREYDIATDLTNAKFIEAAKTLQDAIYSRTGYWLKIVSIDNASDKSIIIKKIDKVYTDDSFKVLADGKNLVIECAFDNKLNDSVASFALSSITLATGDVNFTNTVFKKDISIVTYEEFGAVGNGKTDDYQAFYNTHVFANQSGQIVKATPGKVYYLRNSYFIAEGETKEAAHPIPIKTNTEWTGAAITIDDSTLDYNNTIDRKMTSINVFDVVSDYDSERYTITDKTILNNVGSIGCTYGTTKIEGLNLGYPALLAVYNSNHKVYRRSGNSYVNATTGVQQSSDMHELILIDAEGNIDPSTPFMFDYEKVTKIYVMRADDTPITVKGGNITTIACGIDCSTTNPNTGKETHFGYYLRGLNVSRSYTVVENVMHFVTGEVTVEQHANDGIEGVHYRGFLYGSDATDVTFLGCQVQGRRYYGVSGTYDLGGNMINNITFENCTQINFWIDADGKPTTAEGGELSMRWNDINGKSVRNCWGVGGTNYCKNMNYINSQLSRFDAHSGLYNGKVIGSEITFFAITGKGDFIVEDTKWYSAGEGATDNSLIYMRGDYGSTWEGKVILKNVDAYISSGAFYMFYHGYNNWDYGYKCYIPNIEVDNLNIYNVKTKAPIDELGITFFYGSKDDYMHLGATKNTPPKANLKDDVTGTYSTVTIPNGDWIFDHASNSYVKVPVEEQIRNRNDNPIGMPDYIKIYNISKDYTFNFIRSEDENFYFANTKFYYGTGDNDYYLGTNHNSTVNHINFK